jgi:hypothetical protein
MSVSQGSGSPILVIVRESPLRHRTTALLRSIVSQEPAGLAEVVVLRVRPGPVAVDANVVSAVAAEADWLRQASHLIEGSGCRWVLLPSSVDRYLPGAFERVVTAGTDVDEDQAIVFGCRVKRGARRFRIGPEPFRFDYFALLAGFNYIAPGAAFINAQRLMAGGGFDSRFPNAAVYEYLLRSGAAHRVAARAGPCLETEAHPFPGIPAEYAPLHAFEASLAALHYNRFTPAPGTTLALVGVLAQQLEASRYAGHEPRLADLLVAGGSHLAERYLESLGLEEEGVATAPEVGKAADSTASAEFPSAGPTPATARTIWASAGWASAGWASAGEPGRHRDRLRERLRTVTPGPIWNALRRAKRGWRAFLAPLD